MTETMVDLFLPVFAILGHRQNIETYYLNDIALSYNAVDRATLVALIYGYRFSDCIPVVHADRSIILDKSTRFLYSR